MTKRQYNLDLLKALAIISMVICHAVIQFAYHIPGYEQDMPYRIADIFFGDYLVVAHGFMFAMGVGIVYSRRQEPADNIRRGIRLYLLAFVLNFFRYGIYMLADAIIEGRFLKETYFAFFAQDILHFAGLAMILTGILKKWKLSPYKILGIGIALSAIGGPIAFVCHRQPVFDYILGHFIYTTYDGSTFALFNWYIFVAVGIAFGTILKRTEDKDRFYGRLLRISLAVMIVYIALTAVFGPLFMTKRHWCYAISLPESIGMLSIDMTLLSAFYFLLKKVDVSRFSVFITMSRNIKQIYCIHWCIIGFVDSIFCYLLGYVFHYPFMYLFSIPVLVASYWLAKWWNGRKRKRVNGDGSK